MLSLSSNTLDSLTKEYKHFFSLLVEEASLIGSQMLYNVDKRLSEILHTPTFPFQNIEIIFCGNLCQAQPVQDSWIFEQPSFHHEKMTYIFWKDNVKCFELKQGMRQENNFFHNYSQHN
jgi:hypothetical protein